MRNGTTLISICPSVSVPALSTTRTKRVCTPEYHVSEQPRTNGEQSESQSSGLFRSDTSHPYW